MLSIHFSLLFGSCTSPVAFNRIDMTGPESKAKQFRALSSFPPPFPMRSGADVVPAPWQRIHHMIYSRVQILPARGPIL